MKKDIRLYNVLFPIWFFYLIPSPAWVWILIVNFIIDSLVLFLTARHRGLEGKSIWKKHILPVWLVGFLSDFLGAGLIFLLYIIAVELPGAPNLLLFPWTTLISIPGTALAGVLIYVLNKRLTFRNSTLHPALIRGLCLHLAIFTAPYTMLIPIFF